MSFQVDDSARLEKVIQVRRMEENPVRLGIDLRVESDPNDLMMLPQQLILDMKRKPMPSLGVETRGSQRQG